jgi:hypothetical protein
LAPVGQQQLLEIGDAKALGGLPRLAVDATDAKVAHPKLCQKA